MLSPSLSQLLERARTGFGLEVEVIDARLRHVYPDATTALGRMIEQSPAVRESLGDALAGGRPERLDDSGLEYQLGRHVRRGTLECRGRPEEELERAKRSM